MRDRGQDLYASPDGCRTVTASLQVAGITGEFEDYFYFLVAVGHKPNSIATHLTVLAESAVPCGFPLGSADLFSLPRRPGPGRIALAPASEEKSDCSPDEEIPS